MKTYAEQHGLNLQSFYCCKGQLKKRGLLSPRTSSTDANAMMPVAFVTSPQPRPSARISLANGITIEVPAGISPEALVHLIGAAIDVLSASEDRSPL